MENMDNYGIWQIEKQLCDNKDNLFLVRCQPEGNLYVLKTCTDEDRLISFSREINAVRKMNHPNVIRCVDFSLAPPYPWFVTEYCKEGDLSQVSIADWMPGHKRQLWQQICRGYAHIHSHGIIKHDNDLKNTFLRTPYTAGHPPTAVIGDFGGTMAIRTRDDIAKVYSDLAEDVYDKLMAE